MKRFAVFSTVCLALTLAGACSDETRSSQERLEDQTRETADAAGDYAANASREGAEEIRMRLDQLEAKTRSLRSRMAQAGEEAKASAENGLQSIESEMTELRRELSRFGNASQREWNEFTSDARRKLDQIEDRYDDIDVDIK